MDTVDFKGPRAPVCERDSAVIPVLIITGDDHRADAQFPVFADAVDTHVADFAVRGVQIKLQSRAGFLFHPSQSPGLDMSSFPPSDSHDRSCRSAMLQTKPTRSSECRTSDQISGRSAVERAGHRRSAGLMPRGWRMYSAWNIPPGGRQRTGMRANRVSEKVGARRFLPWKAALFAETGDLRWNRGNPCLHLRNGP
jgi:hypothetical protein